ncbi:MAG: leucyl/phenylalanyl-tRNA--protein transferase [Pseudobdellovibrionaceae bacterium]
MRKPLAPQTIIPAFNPRMSTPEGLVAVGGNLEIETLQEAYRLGIFPWPQEGLPLLWFSPDPRGILDFEDLHIPRSLVKWERQHPHWRYTVNQAFPQVIRQCRLQKREGQQGTWILPEMEEAYLALFDQGLILCLEVWEEDQLIGGIYGVLGLKNTGRLHFSGESMFHHQSNASKMAFVKLVEYLKKQGHTWIDIQMLTEVTTALGGKYISREEFLQRLGV